jgi:hypothetical protein
VASRQAGTRVLGVDEASVGPMARKLAFELLKSSVEFDLLLDPDLLDRNLAAQRDRRVQLQCLVQLAHLVLDRGDHRGELRSQDDDRVVQLDEPLDRRLILPLQGAEHLEVKGVDVSEWRGSATFFTMVARGVCSRRRIAARRVGACQEARRRPRSRGVSRWARWRRELRRGAVVVALRRRAILVAAFDLEVRERRAHAVVVGRHAARGVAGGEHALSSRKVSSR